MTFGQFVIVCPRSAWGSARVPSIRASAVVGSPFECKVNRRALERREARVARGRWGDVAGGGTLLGSMRRCASARERPRRSRRSMRSCDGRGRRVCARGYSFPEASRHIWGCILNAHGRRQSSRGLGDRSTELLLRTSTVSVALKKRVCMLAHAHNDPAYLRRLDRATALYETQMQRIPGALNIMLGFCSAHCKSGCCGWRALRHTGRLAC